MQMLMQPPRPAAHTGKEGIKRTAIAQLVFAILSILLESLFLAALSSETCSFATGSGFWGSALYVTAGILGILTNKRNNRRFLVAYNVMSVFAAATAILALTMSIATASDDWRCLSYSAGHSTYITPSSSPFTRLTIILLCFVHLAEFVVAIWATVYCCRYHRCCCYCCEEDKQTDEQLLPAFIMPGSGDQNPVLNTSGSRIVVLSAEQIQQLQRQVEPAQQHDQPPSYDAVMSLSVQQTAEHLQPGAAGTMSQPSSPGTPGSTSVTHTPANTPTEAASALPLSSFLHEVIPVVEKCKEPLD